MTSARGTVADPGRQECLGNAPRPRLLSAQAAAKYLGVPYTSLRDWALRGHLPIVRVPDCRRLWFDRNDPDRAVESWKERGTL
jgi:hypothetical protein